MRRNASRSIRANLVLVTLIASMLTVVAPPTAANALSFTSISPSSGPTAGGTRVTIKGSGFTAYQARFTTLGEALCTSGTLIDSSTITCTTAPNKPGPALLVIRGEFDPNNSALPPTIFVDRGFNFIDTTPTVTSVSPNSGPTTGGTTMTITGTGFVSGATVTVGGSFCASVVVVSATSITCVTPAGSFGAKNVVVTNADTGTVTSSASFIFENPKHRITYNLGGGVGSLPTQVDISEGASFNTASSVGITRAGFTFSKWSDGSLDFAASSPYTMAEADVVLTATWIENPKPKTTYSFTLNARPLVSTKGQTLTLNGANLDDVTVVRVGGKEAKIVRKSDGEIVIDVPEGAEGYPDVEVVSSSGTSTIQGLLKVVKPYAAKRTQKITQFKGNLPTQAGLAALEKMYLKSPTANLLSCVSTVASNATPSQVAKAKTQAKATCQSVIKYSQFIKSADVQVSKTGKAGSKPALAVTFDRTLSGN